MHFRKSCPLNVHIIQLVVLKNRCLCVTLVQINNAATIGGLSDMAERNLENMTITLTKEEKKALKQAALDNDISASELIRKWIAEYWEKQKETL